MNTKTKTRGNIWTPEEDRLLVNNVLTALKNGDSAMSAFEKTGKKLSRTKAAVAFHWNGKLAKQHTDAVQRAKNEFSFKQIRKKNLQKAIDEEVTSEVTEPNEEVQVSSTNVEQTSQLQYPVSIGNIISELNKITKEIETLAGAPISNEVEELKAKVNELETENAELTNENKQLNEKLTKLQNIFNGI